MKLKLPSLSALLLFWLTGAMLSPAAASTEDDDPWKAETFKGLKLRSIGPAFMSGRIADIAIDPTDPNRWYVAVGSGGVWKTDNAGTTWQPIFDDQKVYSIGDVEIDPNNPHTIWVGTGENVGGRHVSFGDGIYVSHDGGKTWEHKGLKKSEHISTILIHPEDGNTLWVAVQGPLWSSGGERGLYKTTDGGKTWKAVLTAGPWTGVTDVVMDPRNPDRLYAATWQRHRTVAAYMGGGPESGIWRSEDGGESWTRLKEGLPRGNMGKIGLAISPQNPDVVYAAIELDQRKGGVWKTTNRGASWAKQSDAVGGGTGPHYYQELWASPHHEGRIYLASNYMEWSDDGGKTFRKINVKNMHVDFHAMAFRKDDPDYLIVGVDGGLYESFDHAKTWRFIANLPVTQYYKVAVDDDFPFYNIYGGTQDNNTQGGPSRTDDRAGILNSDWRVILFGDGHQPATEPGNPDIVYAQWQQGNLTRYDRVTGEITYVQPQGAEGDPAERFNWDAPILVSPHKPTRIYHASQRLWRSDDRGDTWQAISPDLTRNEHRPHLKIMGRQWQWEAPWDLYAMSQYNTITAIAESPLVEGLLYVGTDDGLIQVSEDGGKKWRRIEVKKLPGVPARAFVNDIKADLHDPDTVYVALDNHKEGDYKPYLYKSNNRGRSWKKISGNLPEPLLVWRLVQDHVNPDLLFLGTEFGLYFTIDGGKRWVQLKGGMPTISIRDLAIQKRENDLVAASFGRGFFVLDDYSPLRQLEPDSLERDALLFEPRRAWWYIPRSKLGGGPKGSQGDNLYVAENPPFGAQFTLYLKEKHLTLAEQRKKREKPLIEKKADTPIPAYERLEAERTQSEPRFLLVIRDATGSVVRRVPVENRKGFQRVAWDLRYPPLQPATAGKHEGEGYGDERPRGVMVAPGTYQATLERVLDGKSETLAGPVPVQVEVLRQNSIAQASPEAVAAFWKRTAEFGRSWSALQLELKQLKTAIEAVEDALNRTPAAPDALDGELESLRQQWFELDRQVNGNRSMQKINTLEPDRIGQLFSAVRIGTFRSTYGPTPTHRSNLDRAERMLQQAWEQLHTLRGQRLPALQRAILEAGGPWTGGMPGMVPPR